MPVGLLPAAGRATRLGPLPCSKEVLPLGFRPAGNGDDHFAVKVACHYALDAFRAARVDRTFCVIGRGKWDIPGYLGNGGEFGSPIAYLYAGDSPSPAHTVDHAYPFVRDEVVVFAFPDILFEPADGFVRLLARLEASGADAVLGLFPAHRPETVDMVQRRDDGRVNRIEVKPRDTALRLTWMIAVWSPAFSAFLHRFVSDDSPARDRGEVHVGHVLQAAIDDRLHVDSVTFPEGTYRDVGTPEALLDATRHLAEAFAPGVPAPTDEPIPRPDRGGLR